MTTNNTIRGVRGTLPPNTIVGRLTGSGKAQQIDLADIAAELQQNIQQGLTGNVSGGLAPIPDGDILSNISGGSAVPIGNTVSATLDHVFSSTQGSILYRDASAWKALGPGTSGNFLKTQGAGANPVWAAAPGGSGALTLISTQTASASASLAWTGLTQATSWLLVGKLLVPATNNTGLLIQFGTGAGPTYTTTGYELELSVTGSGSGVTDFGATAQAGVPCDDGTVTNATPGTSFEIWLETDNANYLSVHGTCHFKGQAGVFKTGFVGGGVVVAAAITAFRVIEGAGNITSGNASLYSLSV